MRLRPSGFSLVELLVTMGVLAILLAAIVPVANMCIGKAAETREISGARRTVEAWSLFASENSGEIIPGYQDAPAVGRSGNPLSFPVNARYVFRLAPYLNYQLKGSLLVNKQTRFTDDYTASTVPSFGINLTFVGGDYGFGSDLRPTDENFQRFGKFVVTRLGEIHSPGKLIVFASARYNDGTIGRVEGYNAIRSPFFQARRWPVQYNPKSNWWDYGAVDPRFNGKAVAAMADGHVELLSFEQLLDMRRWSNQAAQEDNPNWTLRPL
ncbi:MAG: type II secretion system protein [Terrimicrobiaceae bacterium]|nr:type II secretion system protein [Terrimicrobiaceae bacterium]